MKIGIEIPAGSPLLSEVQWNIDPQHGGHKMPDSFPLPLPGESAALWAYRVRTEIPFMCEGSQVEFLCPKLDVDALLTLMVWTLRGGVRNSPDGKMAHRFELARRLDQGDRSSLDIDPLLIGLGRVASDSTLPQSTKIHLAWTWILGLPSEDLKTHTKLALQQLKKGFEDAKVLPCGAGLVLIETFTQADPSRGRGVAQQLGFDHGASTVLQITKDWAFPVGMKGTKFTLTHRGEMKFDRVKRLIERLEPGWSGPEPQTDSWIIGSPQTSPSLVNPFDLVRRVESELGTMMAGRFRAEFPDEQPLPGWPVRQFETSPATLPVGRAEFMSAFWKEFAESF